MMHSCTICHTGAMLAYKGRTDGQFVYALRKDGDLTNVLWEEYPGPPSDVCCRLIQFETDGKWGYTDFVTGEVKIPPVWDFAEPFPENEQARVVSGCTVHWPDDRNNWLTALHVEGGCFGIIDTTGKLIQPCTGPYPGWKNGS